MAQQVVNESSGNAQNVLILSLLLLFINDILNRYANETSYEDYEEDHDDDDGYDDDYEDNYDDNYDEGYKDDYEDDSVSEKKKSASLVRLYGLLALWAICLVLCWMLFYVILQDPLAEDPSSTCSLLLPMCLYRCSQQTNIVHGSSNSNVNTSRLIHYYYIL